VHFRTTAARDVLDPDDRVTARAAPNPFRETSALTFQLTHPGTAEITVAGVRGGLVRRWMPGELPSGEHSLFWDGRDAAGRPVPDGLYFWRVLIRGAGGAQEAHAKMVRMR
jgi:flagellar hook assembly protein FlgD